MASERAHEYKFETLQVHAGQTPDSETHARAVPIYASTAFVLGSFARIDRIMSFKEKAFFYSRMGNPTHEVVETRLAALEKGAAAALVSSGQAAVYATLVNLCGAGDNVVAYTSVYSGVYDVLKETLGHLDIHVRFVTDTSPKSYRDAINDRTKGLFVESLDLDGNVADIEALAKVGHEAGIPVVVENTLGAGGYLIRPIDYGADYVVHSASSYIGGHSSATAGAIVYSGKFNEWTNGKFPELTKDLEVGMISNFSKMFGPMASFVHLRFMILVESGVCSNPFDAFFILQGMETLSLRMEKHCANALALAEWLNDRQDIVRVSYPGLKTHPSHALATKYLKNGFGAVLSFVIRGGSAKTFIKNLKIASNSRDIGGVKTSVVCVIETSDRLLSEKDTPFLGDVTKETIRVSVGIEDIDDLKADFEQALQK